MERKKLVTILIVWGILVVGIIIIAKTMFKEDSLGYTDAQLKKATEQINEEMKKYTEKKEKEKQKEAEKEIASEDETLSKEGVDTNVSPNLYPPVSEKMDPTVYSEDVVLQETASIFFDLINDGNLNGAAMYIDANLMMDEISKKATEKPEDVIHNYVYLFKPGTLKSLDITKVNTANPASLNVDITLTTGTIISYTVGAIKIENLEDDGLYDWYLTTLSKSN